MVDLDEFNQEIDCTYKDERYSVRDNGAVFRHAREGKRVRKYDNEWTFGKPNQNGYLLVSSEVVHRIIAFAFLGEPLTNQHIVDHIDTNRQNNRPENLRWLTKLENILNNPITKKRIEFYCGSVEAFLEDPSILKNFTKKDPNFEWMKTVTPEEAQVSWKRLSDWAKEEKNVTTSKRGSLGEWIFQKEQKPSSVQDISDITTSLSPNAVQRKWKIPSEFPLCPLDSRNLFVNAYLDNLQIGLIFTRNKYSTSIIENFAISNDKNTLWVLCSSTDDTAIKPWSLAQVTYENQLYVHENLGSFFKKEGAEKKFTLVQGLEWTGGDTIDDYT